MAVHSCGKLFGIHERFVFLTVTPDSILIRPVLSKQRAPCFFLSKLNIELATIAIFFREFYGM